MAALKYPHHDRPAAHRPGSLDGRADPADFDPDEEFGIRGAAGAGFETVLSAAGYGGVGGMIPKREVATLAMTLARHPLAPARRFGRLAKSALKIAAGVGEQPPLRDPRFADRVWQENPLFRRVAQGYLACCDTALGVVDDAELDWRTSERLRMPLDNLLALLAPSNNPFLNPEGWKETLDTGGANIRRGAVSLARDLAAPSKLPLSVDSTAFTLGNNIAATPGKVVRRERLYELIEYQAVTKEVDAVPTVIVPSPINKFYLLDLGTDDSVMAELLASGRHIFLPSWVQPDSSHADVGFDAYVSAIIEVLDTVSQITGSDRVHLMGLCGGGELVALAAAHLAAIGDLDRLSTLTIAIAVLDFQRATTTAFLDRKTGERAIAKALRRGHFSAADSARSFALMRPVDGIWSGAVNNYILGRNPPALTLLYWAADQTNMACQFGADMIRTAVDNKLATAGMLEILGEPIDLSKITTDTYVVAASGDHISPWRDCYRTLALLGTKARFVLAGGGHATIVARVPSHKRSKYWTGEVTSDDPDLWLAGATPHSGSWWNDWLAWLIEHEPDQVPAPSVPGSRAYPPLDDAPGTYVHVKLT